MPTRSEDRARRRWPIGLAGVLLLLLTGSLIAALLSMRSIEGAVPGTDAILGLATNGRAFLIGTADGAYTSMDGRRWTRVEGVDGPTLVAGAGRGAVAVSGGTVFTTENLTTLTPVGGEAPAAAAIAAAPSGEIFLATGTGRFFRSDAGSAFEEVGTEGGPDEVVALAAGPGSPPVLLAGGLTSGLWRSEDGGESWSTIVGTPTRGVMVDRRTSGRVFLATAGGMLVSSDGRSWDFTELREPVEALAQSEGAYFAVTAARLVYESADGESWKALALES